MLWRPDRLTDLDIQIHISKHKYICETHTYIYTVQHTFTHKFMESGVAALLPNPCPQVMLLCKLLKSAHILIKENVILNRNHLEP